MDKYIIRFIGFSLSVLVLAQTLAIKAWVWTIGIIDKLCSETIKRSCRIHSGFSDLLKVVSA